MNHPVDAPLGAPADTPVASVPEPETELTGKLLGSTRRSFIRDVAVAGTSTAAALYGLDQAGIADLTGEAEAAAPDAPISEFAAIAPSIEDTIRVPEGFSWQVVIGYGDQFADDRGNVFRYGYNNDYLAYFPLRGSEEGLLFVNHEYVDQFFLHGYKVEGLANGKRTKSRNDVRLEQEMVGNSVVHVRRRADGAWQVVSPSPYNRRIYGGDVKGERLTPLSFTGPLAPGGSRADPKIGPTAQGSLGNCSGGTTPWGTALSCEENYDGYGETFFRATQDFAVGWDFVGAPVGDDVQQTGEVRYPRPEYVATTNRPEESRRYGWVCEHDPYTREPGRKHTALGRFRHENTAFRVARGRKFVIYMGDDQANQGVYKFVSTRSFDPSGTDAARASNLQILTEGQLYVARFAPEGRRRFATSGDLEPVTPESGTGRWLPVDTSDLFDTRLRLAGVGTGETVPRDPADPGQNTLPLARRERQRTGAANTDPADEATFAGRYNRLINDAGDVYLGPVQATTPTGAEIPPAGYYNEWDRHFATNRPEDLEVAPDGSVFVALTNNSSVRDPFGSVRRLVEEGNDPESTRFTWDEFAAGGPRAGARPGEEGFASPDNLVFDADENIWVVTDISSTSIGRGPVAFQGNNAVFMLPRGESGLAYRFATMPNDAEGTGPYFTPDESTLFVNVQHPGENTQGLATSVFGRPETYTSYWPRGNKTAGLNPAEPIPSTVAIYRTRQGGQVPTPPVVPPGTVPRPPRPEDRQPPTVRVRKAPRRLSVAAFRRGFTIELGISEAATIRIEILGRIRHSHRGRRRTTGLTVLARERRRITRGGIIRIQVRPTLFARLLLSRRGATVLDERMRILVEDAAGNLRRVNPKLVVR